MFLIFLYQRWIYKVDPTRVNEFGTTGESDDAPAVQDGDGAEATQAVKSSGAKKDD